VGAEAGLNEQEIVIRASGPKIVMDSAVREALTGKLDASMIDARTAAAWMAHTLALQSGGMIQLAEPDAEHLLIGALLHTSQI